MRVGIPWWIGTGNPLDGIELAAQLGADFIEISLDAPWPEGLSGPDLKVAADQAGIALGMHGPWRTQALAHPRGVLAGAARSVAQECIDHALGAGAEYVVFHVDARDFARFPRPEVVEQGLEHARTSLEALNRSAGDELAILVENTSPPLSTPSELATFLEPLPGLGFAYDPGHAALAEEAGVEGATADPAAWMDAVGERLELLHLMDLAGTPEGIMDHLTPGAGDSEIAGLLSACQAAGCERVLIEAFYKDIDREPVAPKDLGEAVEVVRKLFA